MKEFIISEAQTEKAVLVGLITPEQNEQKVKEYLDELAFLADTAGVEAVKRFYQKLDYPNSVTFVGSGKLQEIKEYVVENEIGLVIFDARHAGTERTGRKKYATGSRKFYTLPGYHYDGWWTRPGKYLSAGTGRTGTGYSGLRYGQG